MGQYTTVQPALTWMENQLVWKIAKLLLMILLPLAWGVGSDFVFARLQRNRKTAPEIEDVSE